MRKQDYQRFPLKTISEDSSADYPDITFTVPKDEIWWIIMIEVNQNPKPPQYNPLYRRCKITVNSIKQVLFYLILSDYKDSWPPVGDSAIELRNNKTINLLQDDGDAGDADNPLQFIVYYHAKKIDTTGGSQ